LSGEEGYKVKMAICSPLNSGVYDMQQVKFGRREILKLYSEK
jgi:hypothetical protein